uniref:Uncharacterized protein n=1 Tax=Glossina morsitans morsitans TaxID=37546 RepID=A0A1B0G7R0_GLOMM
MKIYGEFDMSMLSDFSTLTDLRNFESTLDLVLLISISSFLDFRSAGVRERFFDEEEDEDDILFVDFKFDRPISLLRLERERTEAGESERLLLCERDERKLFSSRVRCERLRSRERERFVRERDRRDHREDERLLRRERDRLRERDLLRDRECREWERVLRLDLLRDRLLVRERERFRDLERWERERLVRRSRERDLERDRLLLSFASIPITGSMAAEIMFCASLTIVMASSISFCAASFDFASGFIMASVE